MEHAASGLARAVDPRLEYDTPYNGSLAGSPADPAEFTLTLSAPPRPAAPAACANPLCRLAARTPHGAAICEQGCGIGDALADEHTCPFGLTMRRAGEPTGPRGNQTVRWLGRRFASIDAMHGALDLLLEAGFDEDTILDHLPPNPVLAPEELVSVVQTPVASGATACELAQAPAWAPAAAPLPDAGAVATQPDRSLLNLLEYLEQVQSLIATADRAESACDRFLRALAGLVPFDEMAIYLRDATAGDLVIAASVERERSAQPSPRAQSCRLRPGDLGSAALAQGCILGELDGRIEPVGCHWNQAGTLAIPLPLGPDHGMGVWIASRAEAAPSSPLGSEPLRMMRLLADLLGLRLRLLMMDFAVAPQISGAEPGADPGAQPGAEPAAEPPCPTWDRAALQTQLKPELARADRERRMLALVRLEMLQRGRAPLRLPREALGQALGAQLRPYDRIGRALDHPAAWFAILPLVTPEGARGVAERLIAALEDTMDEHGGTEELGLRVGAGVALFGADAASVEELAAHAIEAAARAVEGRDDTNLICYDLPASGDETADSELNTSRLPA